jgi:hypothetical protein
LCHPVFHVFLSTDVYTSCSVGTLLFCFVACASTWFVRMRTHARACERRFQEIVVSNIGRNGNPVPHSTQLAAGPYDGLALSLSTATEPAHVSLLHCVAGAHAKASLLS